MLSARTAPRSRSRTRTVPAMALMAALFMVVSACDDTTEQTQAAPAAQDSAPRNSIVEVAHAAGQFSALMRAVEAAGLTETLRSDGPFTVFAPTDGAFNGLPDGALDELMQDPDALAPILLYHVVPGEYTLEDLREMDSVETAGGQTLEISDSRQGLLIGGSNILTANVGASNGIIHVITTVLIP